MFTLKLRPDLISRCLLHQSGHRPGSCSPGPGLPIIQIVGRAFCTRTPALDASRNTTMEVDLSPPDPDLCCRSGCANCVWVKYAELLAKHIECDGLALAEEQIQANIEDPVLKQFILMDIKAKLEERCKT